MTMRDSIQKLLLAGMSVEYKDISICRINDYCPRSVDNETYKYGWQVDCLNSKLAKNGERGYSRIYTKLNKAISEFLKIRRNLYGREIGESKNAD